MLLDEISKPFNSDDYIYELKFDGIRAIIFASPTKVIIMNRHKKDITNLYPELHSIKELVTNNTIFDGEIVVFKNNSVSLVLGEMIKNKLHYVGKVVLSKSNILYDQIKYLTPAYNPFSDYDEKIKYVKPTHKIKAAYMERTKNNHLRQPFIRNQK